MKQHSDASVNKEWWRELFDLNWIRVCSYKNKDTQREARAIIGMLGLPPGSKILDLCCGDGRISLALARLGYKVTGLDLSEVLLSRAQTKALRAGLTIEWVRRDMREIGIENEFDAVVNIFTSFGYFLKEDDDFKALKAVEKALKGHGKLIIDLENIFFLSRAAQLHSGEPMYRPIGSHGGWVEEVMDFDPLDQKVELSLRLCLPRTGITKMGKASYRAYSLIELRKLLEEAGFIIQAVYGDFGLSPYEVDSERMIVLCLKSGRNVTFCP